MRKYLAVVLISGVVSCTNSEKKVEERTDTIAQVKVTTESVELNDAKVQAIYNGYIKLKDALVGTKFEEAKKAALELKADLANYKGCENTALIADKIATVSDIATQRKEFTSLSADVIALFKHADLKKGTIFVQHCPMANKGDGGDWLSSDKKIQNPYYGDEMMECGAVLEEIKASK